MFPNHQAAAAKPRLPARLGRGLRLRLASRLSGHFPAPKVAIKPVVPVEQKRVSEVPKREIETPTFIEIPEREMEANLTNGGFPFGSLSM